MRATVAREGTGATDVLDDVEELARMRGSQQRGSWLARGTVSSRSRCSERDLGWAKLKCGAHIMPLEGATCMHVSEVSEGFEPGEARDGGWGSRLLHLRLGP